MVLQFPLRKMMFKDISNLDNAYLHTHTKIAQYSIIPKAAHVSL